MNLPPPLLHAGMLGTEARPPAGPTQLGIGPVDAALAQAFDVATPEASVLRAAGIIGIARRAGAIAGSHAERLASHAEDAARPAETHRLLAGSAAELLPRVLSCMYDHPALFDELLGRMVRFGYVCAPKHLPRLMELGLRSKAHRRAIKPILGTRGLWLARQDPRWSCYLGDGLEGGERTWTDGNAAQREDYLRELREVDPPRAIELLRRDLAAESAKTRLALVALLRIGLSENDIPFLESLLNDRSRDVRFEAMGLLARFPSSQFADRASALVPKVLFDLPTAEEKQAFTGLFGEAPEKVIAGSTATAQILISFVRPDTWSRWLDLPLAQCAKALAKRSSLSSHTIDAGIFDAVVSYGDRAAAIALLDQTWTHNHHRLLDILPPEDRDAVMVKQIESVLSHPALTVPHWGPRFTEKVLSIMESMNSLNRELGLVLLEIAQHADDSCLDRVRNLLTSPPGNDHESGVVVLLDAALTILQLRIDIRKELHA